MCGAEIKVWYWYFHNEEWFKKKKKKERLIKLNNTPKFRLLVGKKIAFKYTLNLLQAHYFVTERDTSKVDVVQAIGVK